MMFIAQANQYIIKKNETVVYYGDDYNILFQIHLKSITKLSANPKFKTQAFWQVQ